MLIKNYKQLAKTPKRKKALQIINAGIEAVLTKNAIRNGVSLENNVLKIQNRRYYLNKYKRIFVIGAGKASSDMAFEIEKILGKRITKGIVIDTKTRKLRRVKVMKGTHPMPSTANVTKSMQIMKIAEKATENDLIIFLLSGGASALFTIPVKSIKENTEMGEALLKSGANIYDMNTVRRHMDLVKGGNLAKAAHPAAVASIIFSDVPGNELNVIGSGPTVPDRTTIKDATRIIDKYRLPKARFKETPKQNKWFKRINNTLLLTNDNALEAMTEKANKLGIKKIRILTNQLKGESRDMGQALIKSLGSKQLLLASGETTVTVKGTGKGGRNQELCLGALEKIGEHVVISVGTDGIDNSPAAGAIADKETLKKAKKLDIKEYLENNDSYNFFKKIKNSIITGKTGTNVSDIILVLK